ncbi:MAG: excalibur calcium-binding domain-containing protein [Gammaproteobacteria bacterium]|nr:excalibur calcium-binding domain-containing protein [Gammaproteobacteria bacterium]
MNRVMPLCFFIPVAFVLSACSEPNEAVCLNCGDPIWSASSQKVVMRQNRGNALAPSAVFDYDRAMLSTEAAAHLAKMQETTFNLSCITDGTTYTATITDSAGLQSVYQSDNSACGSVSGKHFVSTAMMKNLYEFFIYGCQGKTTCSEMTSCAEATFYLNNCPNTTIDGNNDGVPCERQWCGV